MANEMIEIDIENIMEEIRSNIEQKEYNTNILSFSDIILEYDSNDNNIESFNNNDLNENLFDANKYFNIQVNHEINSAGRIRKLTIFTKKLIRKLTQFYIVPIIDEQRLFNASVVRTLNQINEFIKNQQNRDDKIDNIEYELNKTIKKKITLIEDYSKDIRREDEQLKGMITLLVKKQEETDITLKILSQNLEIYKLKNEKLELLLEKHKEK